jgi:hypothetical protein
MSLLHLVPSCMITEIISFLDDKTSSNLVLTCKKLHKHGITYGYIKNMRITAKTDMARYIRKFCIHSNTIKNIEFIYIDNPQIWLPKFVENITFKRCVLPSYFNPNKKQKPSIVKKMTIIDCNKTVLNKDKFINIVGKC